MALQNEVSFSFYEDLSISVAKATPPPDGDGDRASGNVELAFSY
jgi:hypothetical protein